MIFFHNQTHVMKSCICHKNN